MSPASDALWAYYHTSGDPMAREQILAQHMGLVHHIVRGIAERVGDAVPFDDLLSAGSLGLVKALEAFDQARGVVFATFATPRIRGAVLDELRAADPRPRAVRQRMRRITAARMAIEQREGRRAEPREVAAALEVPLETYFAWEAAAERGGAVSLDRERRTSDTGAGTTLAELLPDTAQPPADEPMLQADTHATLQDGIAALPEQQRVVLALYYHENLTLRQIAEVLHVTESRVSQIRTAAIKALRAAIGTELRP